MKIERRILGILAALILLFWLATCITDVNHPPGARAVRLSAAAVVLAAGAFELRRRWQGIGLFLLLWPYGWLFKATLTNHVSPLFSVLPEFWGGPMAAALAVGFWLNGEMCAHNNTSVAGGLMADAANLTVTHRRCCWLAIIRIAFHILFAMWLLSVVCALVRLPLLPRGFQVVPTDTRHLLNIGPFCDLVPLVSLTGVPPALLLGSLLLNTLNDETCRPVGIDAFLPRLLCLTAISVAVAEAFVALQLPRRCAFDPFPNRNITSLVLALSGLLLLMQTPFLRRTVSKLALVALSLLMLLLACTMGSRNGLFIVVTTGWLALFLKARLWALILAGVLPLVAFLIIWCVPLPQTGWDSSPGLQRSFASIDAIRQGRWEEIDSLRPSIYRVAIQLAKRHPLVGSGPQTFVMFANNNRGFRYADVPLIQHAHSVPLQLAAEIGLIGSAAWLAIWLVIPWLGMMYWECGNRLALVTLSLGVGSFFDAVWLLPGVTTFSVLLVAAACASLSISGSPASTR